MSFCSLFSFFFFFLFVLTLLVFLSRSLEQLLVSLQWGRQQTYYPSAQPLSTGELAAANHKLADAINSHLLGNTSNTSSSVVKSSSATAEHLCSTPAEKMAEKVRTQRLNKHLRSDVHKNKFRGSQTRSLFSVSGAEDFRSNLLLRKQHRSSTQQLEPIKLPRQQEEHRQVSPIHPLREHHFQLLRALLWRHPGAVEVKEVLI